MSVETSFTSGTGNSYTIHQTGGEDNLNFTMKYGGYNSTITFESDLKTGFVSKNPREETMESLMTNVLTDRSDYVNGIYQITSNVCIEMVGDKYYQDSEEANAFVESLNSHNAQVSSPGHNDFGFDLTSIMSNMIPVNMPDLQNRLMSVTATPEGLQPIPSITSLTDLPIALQTCVANQMLIEKETMMKQITTLPLLQMEVTTAQTMQTLSEMEEDCANGDDGGLISKLSGMASSLFTSSLSPETNHTDSYSINDDIVFDGLSDYINNGGIETELRM